MSTHQIELAPDHDDELYDEGPTCPSCDGTVSADALTCACGAVIRDEFWQDHMPGASFEDRMNYEAELEARERFCGEA